MKIEVEGSGGGTATLRVVGPDGINGTPDFPVPCGTETQTVSITASNFPSVVELYEPMTLYWSVKAPGQTQYESIGTTQHDAYLTYAAPPAGSATRERMSFLCNAARAMSAQVAVTDAIHVALDANPPYDPPHRDPPHILTDDWPLLYVGRLPTGEVYVGYCDHQARFMLRCINILGIAGSTYNTFASTDMTVHEPESKMQDGKKYWLKFDFDNDGSVDNNFEGSLIAYPRYYAVWPSLTADSECRLLRQVGPDRFDAKQRWVTTAPPGGFYDPIDEHLPGTEDYPSCP